MQDNGFFQRIGRPFGTCTVFLNYFCTDTVALLFKGFGNRQPNITTTNQNNPLLFAGLFAKNFKGPRHVGDVRKNIALVTCKNLITGFGFEQHTLAANAHNQSAQR